MRSRNPLLTFLLSYDVWVTSIIQVNFRFERYWWFCLMDFWNFHTIRVFEVRESIADISKELLCLGHVMWPLSCWQSQVIRCGHPACRVRQRPWRPYWQCDDADHTRQPFGQHVLLSTPADQDHSSLPHHRRRPLIGARSYSRAYRLLQRSAGLVSEVPDWQASIGSARRRQTCATTPVSVVRYWSDAPTATLAWHSKSGEVQDRSTRLQVPPRVGSTVPLWLLRPGASIVHSLLPTLIPVSGASSHCSSNENEDNWPSRLLPCFAHCLELAPRWFARSWTLHWLLQEQIENFPFFRIQCKCKLIFVVHLFTFNFF